MQHLKNVTDRHQYTKTAEDKKLIFWINAHTPIEKQSNEDWNTPIHLKPTGTHKISFDILVSYHDFLLMFLSPIAD